VCGAPAASIAHTLPSQPDATSTGSPKVRVEAIGTNPACVARWNE